MLHEIPVTAIIQHRSVTWALNKFAPWHRRFNQVIARMVEAGLIKKWKLQTWSRMKENSGQEPVAFINPPAAEPLTLDTLQAAFLGGYSTWM